MGKAGTYSPPFSRLVLQLRRKKLGNISRPLGKVEKKVVGGFPRLRKVVLLTPHGQMIFGLTLHPAIAEDN